MPHFGGHLREAFSGWVEAGMPAVASVEEHYEPQPWAAERLLGVMCHCSDVMPSGLCGELDVGQGSTYARAAQRLLAERKRSTGRTSSSVALSD